MASDPGAFAITQFSDSEAHTLTPFFSNMDRNVFVLLNLPEVIKGTLFSRYSRSDKSARKLLLDEFIPNKDILNIIQAETKSLDSALAVSKAEDFYQRVLVGYGDDSVAELAGAHIACENVSSLAGDYLTDSRIGLSYLEKSARYIPFDKMVNGKYLWYRDQKLMESKFGDMYEKAMDNTFELYSKWLPQVISYIKEVTPKTAESTDRAYESAVRAKACDVLKNMLTAGRLTNVGIFGNGRAFEYLISKLYSCDLPEANRLAQEMHAELSHVIPAFVRRSQPSEYVIGTRTSAQSFARQESGSKVTSEGKALLRLVDYDRDAEVKVLAAMMYPYSGLQLSELRKKVEAMPQDKRKELIKTYLSKRRNRRDKPGRALENASYTFEMVASYGAFRDVHRHRILSLERQMLNTDLGFEVPEELESVGLVGEYQKFMKEIGEVHKKIAAGMPVEAQYVVPRAYLLRWYIKLNLREVYHFTELRSTKQGHPDYRKIAQEMKRQIEAVHPSLIEHMQVDMNDYTLPRMESENRIDRKLAELDKKKEDAPMQN